MKQIAKNFGKTGSILATALFIGLGYGLANGQIPATGSSNEITSAPANLIEATSQYKASSKELLAAQETEISKAEAKLQELRQLVSEGLIARAELDAEEQKLVALRGQLQATQKQIADSDTRVAQIRAEQELAKKQATAPVKLAWQSRYNPKLFLVEIWRFAPHQCSGTIGHSQPPRLRSP